MSSLKEKIGIRSSIFKESIEESDIIRFCKMMGAPRRDEVPMCFLAKVIWGSEMDLFDRLEIKLTNVLHGEQEFGFIRPLKPGMKVEVETVLQNGTEKRGGSGAMFFLVFETKVWEHGKTPETGLVATSRKTGIVRLDV